MEVDEKVAVIDAYADVLNTADTIVIPESALPYPKEVISDVLLAEMKENDNADVKAILHEAYLRLELFLPNDDFDKVSRYLELIGELADSQGSPEDIFREAAEKVPTTDDEVHDIMEAIEARIVQRKETLANI